MAEAMMKLLPRNSRRHSIKDKVDSEELNHSFILLTPDTTPTKDGSSTLPECPDSPSQGVILDEHSYSLASSPKSSPEPPSVATNQTKGKRATAKKTKSNKTASYKAKKINRTNPSESRDTSPKRNRSVNQGAKDFQRSRSKSAQRSKSAETKRQLKPNHLVTEYFPIRRSYRVTSSELKKRQRNDMEEAILSKREEGLKVVEFEGKGRGVIATRDFQRGEFVVEYSGDLVDLGIAKEREGQYSIDPAVGCYMYYFNHKNKRYCVDATAESGRLGRLLNHSRQGNCATRVVDIDNRPYLILVAGQRIKSGEELLYDYGDRSKESLESHPWLAL